MKNNFREELVMTKENERHRSSCSQMLFKTGFVTIFWNIHRKTRVGDLTTSILL